MKRRRLGNQTAYPPVGETSVHIWAGRKQKGGAGEGGGTCPSLLLSFSLVHPGKYGPSWSPVNQLDIKVLSSSRLLVPLEIFIFILNSHRLKCHHFPLHPKKLCNVWFHVSPYLSKGAAQPLASDPLPPVQKAAQLQEKKNFPISGKEGKPPVHCDVLWWLLSCGHGQQVASPSLPSTHPHTPGWPAKSAPRANEEFVLLWTQRGPILGGGKQHCALSSCLGNTQLYAVAAIKEVLGVTELVCLATVCLQCEWWSCLRL